VLVLTEYGGHDRFPVPSYQLNHQEYSIHFGHVVKCARQLGFECKLISLKEFLQVADDVVMLDGHDEHIQCLDFVLRKYGQSLPYALISEAEFLTRFGGLIDRIELQGFSFSPLRSGFHYGPRLADFLVMIATRPFEAVSAQ